MSELNFEFVSPEKLLLSETVKQVAIPGREGDFVVMPQHAPLMSTMRPGALSIIDSNGKETRYFVSGGLVEVNNSGLTVLAEGTVLLDELDKSWLDGKIKDSEEDISDAKDDITKAKAIENLNYFHMLRDAV